jgi:hypothetical protein
MVQPRRLERSFAHGRSLQRICSLDWNIKLALTLISLTTCTLLLILSVQFPSASKSMIRHESTSGTIVARPTKMIVSSASKASNTSQSMLHPHLPDWADEYLKWHAIQRTKMSLTSSHQYLIYTCLQSDVSCGGLSDRIKSLPYFLLLAAKSKRIFLIYWNRPCRLEEFWIPPLDGLDWTTPEWLVNKLVHDRRIPLATTHSNILHHVANSGNTPTPILTVRLQDQHGGSDYYNAQQLGAEGPRAFRRSFRALVDKCFVPTPPLARAIHLAMARLQLVPGQYTAAHFRAKYNEIHPLSNKIVKSLARNAINCASELRRSVEEPIFFASDSQVAMQSVSEYREITSRPIVMSSSNTLHEPLHLDKATSTSPSDYYTIFVDLFVLSNANCIAHGQGGYGRLAVLLSHNASCFKTMITGGRIVECKWKELS